MNLSTIGVVITDAIKIVQTNKKKLTMSIKGDNNKESEEPDYDDGDKEQLEEEQEKKTRERETGDETF
jgi:hypothetical protein